MKSLKTLEKIATITLQYMYLILTTIITINIIAIKLFYKKKNLPAGGVTLYG